jgi:putative transposase
VRRGGETAQHERGADDARVMTLPRRISSGVQYMITRRCTERMFLLKADEKYRSMFWYLIAEAVERHGVLVHAAVFMSNHLHMVVTDVRGNLPEFCHLMFGQIAKAVNAATGHVEAVFAKADRPNLLELVTPEAVIREIAYLLNNPAKAGLVETAGDWPGLITRPEDLAAGAEYIGCVGDNPYLKEREIKTRVMQIVPVPGLEGQATANVVAAELERHEREARKDRRSKGLGVLGAENVRRQHWRKMPKTGARLFGLKPTIAAARRIARIVALVAVKKFRREYLAALTSYRRGQKSVEFPHGTWMMGRFFGATVAAALPNSS